MGDVPEEVPGGPLGSESSVAVEDSFALKTQVGVDEAGEIGKGTEHEEVAERVGS